MNVYTTAGTLVQEARPPLTEEQAQVSAAERNKRAEELGIETRYEAKESA